MSLISKTIKHLFGGVSQQDASLRDVAQCELMENCWPDVAVGLGKRPPLVHGAKLNTDTSTNRKVHLINRDAGEQYVVTLGNQALKVYDRLTGTEKTVATPDGLTYLASSDPASDFALVTVADTTFIANKSKTVSAVPPLPALPNSLTYESEFEANGWTIQSSSLKDWGNGSYADVELAPDGTQTGDVITQNTYISNRYNYPLQRSITSIPFVALQEYEVSVYMKHKVTGSYGMPYGTLRLARSSNLGLMDVRAIFDLINGTVTGSTYSGVNGVPVFSIEDAGGGWWKCSLKFIPTGTPSSLSWQIMDVGMQHNATSFTVETTDGTSAIAIWKAYIGVAGTTEGTRQWAAVQLLTLPTDKALCTSGGKFRITVNGTNYETSVNDYATIALHAAALAALIEAGEPTMVINVVGTDTVLVEADPLTALTVTATAYDETDDTVVCTAPVVNNTRVSVTSGAGDPNTAAFFTIVMGVARQTYTVKLASLTVSYTVDADGVNALTTTIAAALANSINAAAAGYHAVRIGSTVKVTQDSGAQPAITAVDSYGSQGMLGFTDSVQSQSQLPADFWEGYTLKVRGALDGGGDDYYVTFTGDAWAETAKPGIANYIADTSMPHKLVREADGTFTFSKNTWLPRRSGDEDSNPMPSLVGRKINNIFFFRERLGLLSGENIIMSRVADYYNLFAASVAAVLDDDPIDVSVADTRVSYLYHALPFQDSLLLFSDSAQYQLSGGDVLSASTVRLDPTTRYKASKVIQPVAAGRSVFFPVAKGDHSTLREYFVSPDATYSEAADITAHVPSFVPSSIKAVDASSLIDVVAIVPTAVPNEVYVYKYLWSGDQKVQSSWGKWVLDSGASIIGAAFVDAKLALVVVRSDGTYAETIDLQSSGSETNMDRVVYLDRRFSLTGVYNGTSGKTTWTLPYADSGSFEVVRGSAFGATEGVKLTTTKISTTQIEAVGDYSAGTCFVGKPYTMRYRFSEFFIRDGEGVAVRAGRMQLRTLTVSYSKTGGFTVEVTPSQRSTYSYPLDVTPPALVEGKRRVPVLAKTDGVTIDLVNSSPYPSFFQGAEWEAEYTMRAKRL